MENAKAILKSLKERGQRMTRTREAMVEIFTSAQSPVSAAEVIAALTARKLGVNKTTVYREFDFLQAQGVIREIDLLEGQKRYELSEPDHHHHHLVCTKCSQIQCIDLPKDLDTLERRIAKEHNFKIEHHVLEFFGLCSRCR
jgi:Fe2+ or Zn2+ uptake regulation protein